MVNEKRGVGKITPATTISYLLYKIDKKVLLIDFNGQANSTMLMSDKNPNKIEVTISTILNKIINHNYILPSYDYIIKSKGINLLPSNANLFSLESKLSIVTLENIY